MGEPRAKVRVRGTVVALERDEHARVQQVLLVTDEGVEFYVENTRIGQYLADFVDSEVEVIGLVEEADDGEWTLRPVSFREVGFDDDAASDWVRSWRVRAG